MLTARGEEPDRLRGLDTGADDFITKPFSPAELIARIRAVLRRVRPAFAEQLLAFHDLRMDLAAHRVFRGEREVHLSPTEFRLLRHFLEHPGRVFSRAQLLDRVWGSDLEIELRTVDATIRRLRRALNAGGEADLLRTVRAEGYALDLKLHHGWARLSEGLAASEPPSDGRHAGSGRGARSRRRTTGRWPARSGHARSQAGRRSAGAEAFLGRSPLRLLVGGVAGGGDAGLAGGPAGATIRMCSS